jgi:hypothetical protein
VCVCMCICMFANQLLMVNAAAAWLHIAHSSPTTHVDRKNM